MAHEGEYTGAPLETNKTDFDHFTSLGQGGYIHRIPDGALVPVGGSILGTDFTEMVSKADLSTFEPMYEEVSRRVSGHATEKVVEWLRTQQIDFPPEIFKRLYYFTKTLAELYPVHKEALRKRSDRYKKERQVKLSDIMNDQMAACAEYATLAQGYLQKVDVPSFWFSGDILMNKEHEFAVKHTFLILQLESGDFIYDPARPVHPPESGCFPRIYKLDVDFLEEMKKSPYKRFVTAHDLLIHTDAFYGISSDGSSIDAERDII